MENVLLTLVVVLLVLVLLMMAGLFLLGLRVLRERREVPATGQGAVDDRYHPAIRQRIAEAHALTASPAANCHLHPQEPAEGVCAICERSFCKVCLKSHRTLVFCREHLALFNSGPWDEVHTVKSNAADPEAGVRLVDWKREQWEQRGTPLFLETHYKINVEGDMIETWVVLFARAAERDEVRQRLEANEGTPTALN